MAPCNDIDIRGRVLTACAAGRLYESLHYGRRAGHNSEAFNGASNAARHVTRTAATGGDFVTAALSAARCVIDLDRSVWVNKDDREYSLALVMEMCDAAGVLTEAARMEVA